MIFTGAAKSYLQSRRRKKRSNRIQILEEMNLPEDERLSK